MALSLISLNIERDKHFDRFLPFLKSRNPDVVCFQELLKGDIPRITDALGGSMFHAPFFLYEQEGERHQWGAGIWSRLPPSATRARQYAGNEDEGLRVFREDDPLQARYDAHRDLLLEADIEKDGETYRILTTHFIWTPDGEANDAQRDAATRLLALLEDSGEFVLCGDMNAPRGKEIFSRFASVLTDNIPPKFERSLDPELHRAGHLEFMVDALFTTPSYSASNVSLEFGVSDHAAIVATVAKDASGS